jgi:CRP-like cAMP-binding protein
MDRATSLLERSWAGGPAPIDIAAIVAGTPPGRSRRAHSARVLYDTSAPPGTGFGRHRVCFRRREERQRGEGFAVDRPGRLDPAPAQHRLAEVPLFAGLPPAVVDELARAGRVRRYPAGQVLFNEGDPGDALVVLEEGQLRVSRFSAGGEEAVLAVVEPPGAVGELALLDGEPRDATVTAQRPVTVRLVPRSVFIELVRREPALVEGLLRTLAGWVRHSNRRHADLMSLDVPGRLAKWLLRRAGDSTGAGVPVGMTVVLGRSQGELAAELGTTRSTLNRALQGFADLGLIAVDGDRVTLTDPRTLAAYTG